MCPKCGGLAERRFEPGVSFDKCMICSNQWNYIDYLNPYEEREVPMIKNEKPLAAADRVPPGPRITEKPEDGCTNYSRDREGGKKYYCGDPRRPGSKFCERHFQIMQRRKNKGSASEEERTADAPAPKAETPAEPPAPKAEPTETSPSPADPTRPRHVEETIGYLRGQKENLKKEIEILDQTIKVLEMV